MKEVLTILNPTAVGSVVTLFAGTGALDLRAAIQSGNTRALRTNRSPLLGARTLTRSIRRKLNGEAVRELTARRARGPQH